MKTRTLSKFLEENGVNLIELSESTDVAVNELERIPKDNSVPIELGKKIVKEYSLPDDYFTEDLSKVKASPAKRNLGYFIKLSLCWDIYITIAFIIVGLLWLIIRELFLEITNVGTVYSVFAEMFSVINAVLLTVACVLLSKYFERKNAVTGNFGKYKFLYYLLPILAFESLKIIPTIFYTFTNINSTELIEGIVKIAVFIGFLLSSAHLMRCAYEADERATRTAVNILVILGLVTVIICNPLNEYLFWSGMAKYSVSESAVQRIPHILSDMGTWVPSIIQAVAYLPLAFGLAVGAKKFLKLRKLWYAVLPIINIFVFCILAE